MDKDSIEYEYHSNPYLAYRLYQISILFLILIIFFAYFSILQFDENTTLAYVVYIVWFLPYISAQYNTICNFSKINLNQTVFNKLFVYIDILRSLFRGLEVVTRKYKKYFVGVRAEYGILSIYSDNIEYKTYDYISFENVENIEKHNYFVITLVKIKGKNSNIFVFTRNPLEITLKYTFSEI